jgi:hypothetical protein
MTTTGTYDFNLEFTEVAEEAWERAGREMRSGYDLRTARRSMNLMTIEWQNRGINMWTIDEGSINLIQGQNTYDLPADTIDLLEHVVRTGAGNVSTQSDLTITGSAFLHTPPSPTSCNRHGPFRYGFSGCAMPRRSRSGPHRIRAQ